MKKIDIFKKPTIWFILFALVVYFSANIISNSFLKSFRLDFTEEKLHTISDSTKSVLSKIDEPIQLKVYFSSKLGQMSPPYKDLYDRLKITLQNYSKLAEGNLEVSFFTPEPYSQLEDDALLAGLKSANMGGLSQQVYFGLVATNSISKKEVIPFFDLQKQPFLEYDLALLIHKLSSDKSIKIGVLSALAQIEDTLMIKQLKQLYDIDILPLDGEEIDSDISTLMVVAPSALSKKAIFSIDQYALNGGNILLFSDPLVEKNKELEQPNQELVTKLLKAWGVEYDANLVSIDAKHAVSVNSNTPYGVKSFKHSAWLHLLKDSFSKEHIITANLEKVMVASSGFFKQTKQSQDKKNKFIPLITTSNTAMQRHSSVFKQLSAKALSDTYRDGDKTLTIGVHISSSDVQSIFQGGLLDENDKQVLPKITKSVENVNVILVSDTDILMDNMWARVNNFLGQSIIIPTADNGRFVSNAIENLNGNDDFIALRGRGKITREFTLLKNMQTKAEQQFLRKESELRSKLAQLQTKINQQRQSIKDSSLLTREQQKLINQAQTQMVNVRKELRLVQHNLRQDIESVKNIFKWSNIIGVPMLIILLGYLVSRYRNKKRKQYFA